MTPHTFLGLWIAFSALCGVVWLLMIGGAGEAGKDD